MTKKQIKYEADLFGLLLEVHHTVLVGEDYVGDLALQLKEGKASQRKMVAKLAKGKAQFKELTGSEFKP